MGHMRMYRFVAGLLGLAGAVSCARTLPGTHVELIKEEGRTAYVAGAAAPGLNQGLACAASVNRAVAAIALRFSQEQDDLSDTVAKAVGVRDADVFLQQYAKDDAQHAAVQDVQFDPGAHICMATVRWKPPLFIEQAVLTFAQGLRAQAAAPPAAAAPPPVPPATVLPPPAPQPPPAAPAAPIPPPPPAPAPVPPVAIAPPPAASPAPPVAAPSLCPTQKAAFAATQPKGARALADFEECLRRTSQDANVCYRYRLYVDEAQKKTAAAGQAWAACASGELPLRVREIIQRELPGHAGKIIENRADASVVVWTYSPAESLAFALEITPAGQITHREALPANQVTWVRQQFNM